MKITIRPVRRPDLVFWRSWKGKAGNGVCLIREESEVPFSKALFLSPEKLTLRSVKKVSMGVGALQDAA